ncbi:MAG: acetyltransferase [Planctomycetes bacterium]|nr:acetyltransferase [Planctomycetota bacterium]MCB9885137.1 acetyltransferase [Planctomycetota bacterium]
MTQRAGGGRVVIVGAGGHGRDTLDVFRAENATAPGRWDVLGFVSEVESDHGRDVAGLPVLGGWQWFATQDPAALPLVVCAVGAPSLRRRLVGEATRLGLSFASVVHPAAVVPGEAAVGVGAIVSAGAVTTSSMRLGDHVIVNLGCTIAHDAVLGDFVTLAPGVHISGHVQIGGGCDLGTGAVVLPKVKIGEGTIVGAGAVVTRDLPANVTAVGVPARVIKTRVLGT